MKLPKPIKLALKVAGWAVLALVVYAVAHVLLAYYPQPLFAHQRTYKNFTVYMREEIPSEITDVLDRVQRLLSASEINDENQGHAIYIFNSYRLSRFLLLRNVHFGANLPNGNSFITMADVRQDIARCERLGLGDTRLRRLSETITHEIVHALIRDHVGWRAERELPVWIKEGYCEYIAQGAAIDPRRGIDALTANRAPFPGLQNFRHRLVMQYLIHHERLTFEEILRQPPDYWVVLGKILDGLREDEEVFLERLDLEIDSPGGP